MGFSYAPAVQVRSGTERATLVRRTYGLVFLSVITTILGSAFAFAQPSVMDASAQHPFIMMIALFAPLIMAQRAAREFPKNIILTFLFTFIEGIFIAPFLLLAERNAPGVVSQAAILTFAAFGVLSLYAVVSRRDFKPWGSFLMVGLWVLIGTSLLNFFFQNPLVDLWLASITVLIFSGLLVFDTWRLRNFYGPDDYVGAAVQIYLDLLNIFMAILRVTGNRRS